MRAHDLRVDPDRAAIERQRRRRVRRRLEAHLVRVVAEEVRLANQLVAVLVREMDIERELRHFLRLDQRQLGDLPVLPLHAVEVEVLPHPVLAAEWIGEVIAGDGRLDRLAAGHREAQLGRVARDVARLDRLLVRLVRLVIADDLFDRDAALRSVMSDRFLGHVLVRLLVVLDREARTASSPAGMPMRKRAALLADVGHVLSPLSSTRRGRL